MEERMNEAKLRETVKDRGKIATAGGPLMLYEEVDTWTGICSFPRLPTESNRSIRCTYKWEDDRANPTLTTLDRTPALGHYESVGARNDECRTS